MKVSSPVTTTPHSLALEYDEQVVQVCSVRSFLFCKLHSPASRCRSRLYGDSSVHWTSVLGEALCLQVHMACGGVSFVDLSMRRYCISYSMQSVTFLDV